MHIIISSSYTADFIELINNWLDLSNVSHRNTKQIPFKALYGTFMKEQESFFNELYDTILARSATGNKNTNETRHLLNIIKGHGLNYLLTSNINQDALENLFS